MRLLSETLHAQTTHERHICVCFHRKYGRNVNKKEVKEAIAFASANGDGTVSALYSLRLKVFILVFLLANSSFSSLQVEFDDFVVMFLASQVYGDNFERVTDSISAPCINSTREEHFMPSR